MRGTHTRKRSNPFTNNGPSKKARMGRRKFKRKGRSMAMTSKSISGTSFGFRSKKVSRSRWKKMLWDSTLQKPHYRNIASGSTGPACALNTGLMNYTVVNIIANSFWTAGGGAQQLDNGTAVPNFSGDLIVRGGIVGIRICNVATGVRPIQCNLTLVKTCKDTDAFTAVWPRTANIGSDPTVFPDFKAATGFVIARRNFLLENSTVFDYKFRLPIFKTGQLEWNTDNIGRYCFIIGLSNCEDNTADVVASTAYCNFSFCGDST